jgi:hypothetical protein
VSTIPWGLLLLLLLLLPLVVVVAVAMVVVEEEVVVAVEAAVSVASAAATAIAAAEVDDPSMGLDEAAAPMSPMSLMPPCASSNRTSQVLKRGEQRSSKAAER